MNKYISGIFHKLTDKGLTRELNEDSALVRIDAKGQVILAVCDGMGGRNKGDYCSQYITKELEKEFLNNDISFKNEKQIKKWLFKVIKRINRDLFIKGNTEEEYLHMGSTLSAVLIAKDVLVTAQVGDSRIYFLSDKKFYQASVDQTYVQYLVHHNKIKEEDMSSHVERHKITNAIGIRKVPNVDFKSFEYTGQNILLCTDGVYNNLSFNVLSSVVKGNDSCENKCKQIISFSNANGGTDNMAVVLWESSF